MPSSRALNIGKLPKYPLICNATIDDEDDDEGDDDDDTSYRSAYK